MFERNFITREVQKMTQMLQKIRKLKKEKNLDKALEEINQNYGRFFDLARKDITDENLGELLDRCTDNGDFSSQLGFALGDLIQEEAEVLESQGNLKQAKEKYQLVIELYRRAIAGKNAAVPLNARQKMVVLKQKVESLSKL